MKDEFAIRKGERDIHTKIQSESEERVMEK